jgi:hypothetical protein
VPHLRSSADTALLILKTPCTSLSSAKSRMRAAFYVIIGCPLEHEGHGAHRSGGPLSMPNTLVKRTAEAVGYGKMGTSFRSTRPGAAVSYCHRSVVWWLPSFCRSSPARAAVQLGGA